MKRIFTLCLAALIASSVVVLTGCGPKIANDADTLEIYIGNFGYGYTWLNEEIELFKQQSWVQEKYPNLSIPTPQHNSESNFSGTRITSGKSNTIDLFFTAGSAASFFTKADASGKAYFEDLKDVYESKVPGEADVTVASKMKPELLASQEVKKADGAAAYYGLPWVDGYMGLLYNKTLLEKYMGSGYALPRTTAELQSLAQALSTKKDDGGKSVAPFISAATASYWTQMFATFWAQYEGIAGYGNYWNGVNAMGEMDGSIFAQTGRLKALETVESLIGRGHGYIHSDVSTMSFTTAQSKFLLGDGIIMANGDWFENEMRETKAENPYNYDITYMRIPVISSITEKCAIVKDDKALSFVVGQVDDGKTYEEAKAAYASNSGNFDSQSRGELAKPDFDRIAEARKMMYRIDGHEAYIPSYATAKGVAKDFLRFLSTDIAIESFIDTTKGCGTAYQYDLKTKNPTAYNALPSIHKDRMAIDDKGVRLPSISSFKLNSVGGLLIFAKTSNLEVVFTAQNAADRKTPQKIFQDDIDHYTSNQYANWNSLLMRAGLR